VAKVSKTQNGDDKVTPWFYAYGIFLKIKFFYAFIA